MYSLCIFVSIFNLPCEGADEVTSLLLLPLCSFVTSGSSNGINIGSFERDPFLGAALGELVALLLVACDEAV